MNIKKILPGIKENVLLSNYTTFKIGGPAKYFFIAKNQKDLIKAIKMAKKLNLPFFILGSGSNLLVSDEGFRGLIIKFQVSGFKFQENNLYVGAGVLLNDVVKLTNEQSLTGLEWAAGLPGTVGGAICGNAGWPSNKKNISAIIKSVEVLELNKKPKIKKFNQKECCFGYRDSIFKHNKNLIILSAFLKLKKGKRDKIKKEIIEIIKTRRDKIPSEPSAGCIFQNPSPAQISPKFMAGKGFSAGDLIEKCSLKGKKIGKAQVSKKHANFIINLGGAKAKDVISLIKMIKQKVKNKFGVKLEEEIQHLK